MTTHDRLETWWSSLDEVASLRRVERRYEPQLPEREAARLAA